MYICIDDRIVPMIEKTKKLVKVGMAGARDGRERVAKIVRKTAALDVRNVGNDMLDAYSGIQVEGREVLAWLDYLLKEASDGCKKEEGAAGRTADEI